MTTTYGITRIENQVSRTVGWLVALQRRGERFRKLFSDGVHGGKRAALTAAKTYRDNILLIHRPFTAQEHAAIRKKNNHSGVVGISRYVVSGTKRLPPEKHRFYWVASWSLPDGTRRRVRFSVLKYGEERAKQMAIRARQEGLQTLTGDFNPGAKRPGYPKGVGVRTRRIPSRSDPDAAEQEPKIYVT